MCAALTLVLGVALVGSPLRATAEETPSPAPTVTTATPATEEVVTPTAAPTTPEVTEAPAPTTSPVPSKVVKSTAKPRAPMATAKTKPTPSKTTPPTLDPKAFLTVRMTAQGIVTVKNNSQHVLTTCRVYHDMIDRGRALPPASPDLPGLVEVMAPGYTGVFDFTDGKRFGLPVDGDAVYVQCIVPGGTRPTNVGDFVYTAPTSGYGKLYVLCQKVGVEPGWKVVVSQDNNANNQNRFLLAVTEGISPQEARDKYPASKCAKFNQPDDKVTYTQWVDTSSNCETGLVTQTRTVTTTPYVWVAKKHKWVEGAPVVTTETRTRAKTSDEVKACVVVKPTPKPTPNKGPVKVADVCKNRKGSQASVSKGLVKKGTTCVKPTHKPVPAKGGIPTAKPRTGDESSFPLGALAGLGLLVAVGSAAALRRRR